MPRQKGSRSPNVVNTIADSTSNIGSDSLGDLCLAEEQLRHQLKKIIEATEGEKADTLAILNLYEKFSEDIKPSRQNESRLKTAYENALKHTEAQFTLVCEAQKKLKDVEYLLRERHTAEKEANQRVLEKTSLSVQTSVSQVRRGAFMLMLQQFAINIPLWVSVKKESPPPLCGAIPAAINHICEKGDLVAARVKNADGDENWILAEVKFYNSAYAKYTVEDIDEEEKSSYTISRRKVIPLPVYLCNPQHYPETVFPLNSLVLALYPQTSCFYKGTVFQQPQDPFTEYLIAFEDNTYATGFSPPLPVLQRYVLNYHKTK
ncbi:SAGA-associated factor 29 -like protein [Trichinella pseudospiralis]|uniref:SAGA-associated factor 29-like protein n=2 Tax=Trichinella pseudospiralis TaxID=6337 RepID=A0A0V1EYZ9_TRIPS|nr:SAGA-associated factor 29 -like protein [Trichinella pseudospiralis]KRY79056.1 SAGA-associated factor 29 -like protein [Trichinella pseudospiralis]KRY91369.1 SAGA-associated factor 29 -like protein [Trichinella pseudospiralis]KRZ33793.1 SAGA-associated factor 29 -like protein [Trichinella pseudospiralis]KRZ45765.1 SAGA-associated factor 29 -like protein [Trichinella pseudospiralis]